MNLTDYIAQVQRSRTSIWNFSFFEIWTHEVMLLRQQFVSLYRWFFWLSISKPSLAVCRLSKVVLLIFKKKIKSIRYSIEIDSTNTRLLINFSIDFLTYSSSIDFLIFFCSNKYIGRCQNRYLATYLHAI